jgi:hypothetical protein
MKKILSAIIASVVLTGCSEYLFYQQGPTTPATPGFNHYDTTWIINDQVIGYHDPAGIVSDPPVGWFCVYSKTYTTTTNHTLKWLTCSKPGTIINYSLTCKYEAPDYNEFQINIHNNNDYISASCETKL